ncbi:hypothetical protein MP228_012965 [Amoeboaphelidium protococcarum]|nr:hypothetical protein MP228_012965 [Amoeboaphelidium protococcarum]
MLKQAMQLDEDLADFERQLALSSIIAQQKLDSRFAELRERLERFNQDLEALRLRGKFIGNDTNKKAGDDLQECDQYRNILITRFRKITNAYKAHVKKQDAEQRRQLMGDQRESKVSSSASAVNNNDRTQSTVQRSVNDALKRASQLMSAEIERSAESLKSLESSSKLLNDTGNVYGEELQHALGKTDEALTKLAQREFTDKVLIILAVSVFMAVVAYIVKERLLSSSSRV